MFGAYDVHNDRLRVRLRPRRRGRDNLAFMTQIRDAIPARRRIYWIQDNLYVCHRNGPHRDKRIRLLEARHQIAA